jgi:5-methylcytosine-specific restriction enzyme subunit McrC
MSNKNFIQVFEYQKLKYDESLKFKKHHFDSLVVFNEKNQNKYFTIIHKGVMFNSYVGVIQIGGLTIEILPKADKSNNPDKITWQGILLNMLKVCKHITIDKISETNLKKRNNSILDVYFEMYLNEVENLIKKGLVKKYKKRQSNQLALKGKLVFSQNIQKNIIHKEKFFCEHEVYNKDHLLHQILYRALIILKDLTKNDLKDKLNRLIFEFMDYQEVNIKSSHFDKIIPDRKIAPYGKALDIAKMIILNYSPNLNSGGDNMITLLFDMNKLWEEYIYRILQKHKPTGYEVTFQNSDRFWENKSIKPDIVITTERKEKLVLDTKWKIISSNNPSDDDLKQMFTYNLLWQSKKSLLLYPKTNQEEYGFGNYHYTGFQNKCKVGFLDLLHGNKMRESNELTIEILEKFLE